MHPLAPQKAPPRHPQACHAGAVDNKVTGVTPSAWRACFPQSPVRVLGSGRQQADVPGSRDKQAGGRSRGNGALTRHTLLRQRTGSPPRPGEGPVPARLPRAVEGLPARSADTRHAGLNRLLNLPGDRGLCPSQPAPARTSAGATFTSTAAARPSVGCTEGWTDRHTPLVGGTDRRRAGHLQAAPPQGKTRLSCWKHTRDQKIHQPAGHTGPPPACTPGGGRSTAGAQPVHTHSLSRQPVCPRGAGGNHPPADLETCSSRWSQRPSSI